MESELRASIIRIKELTYAFSQLRQRTEHLENLENERSVRGDESSLGYPQWTGGSQDKVETAISHSEIETILNNLQERLYANDNCLTSDGVKMGELAYTSFRDLKDDVLKEMPREGFGIFVDAWYLCEFFNM